MTQFECAVAQTKGTRDYQEDTAAVWPGGDDPFMKVRVDARAATGIQFAVLADGMGGHAGGSLASRIVCERFLAAAVEFDGAAAFRLAAGLEAANDAIADKVAASPMLAGMGSTVIGAALSSRGLEWVSVGDSPMFLYRDGEVIVLNEDHSLAPELDRQVAAGRITAEEARRDPRRHMLRSAVTGEQIDMVDVSRTPLLLDEGDVIVLASDGIATLELITIAQTISASARKGAAAIAKALIATVDDMRAPYQDNATVVVVKVAA